MVRRISGRSMWLHMFAVFAALMLALPAAAQTSGTVKGTVLDEQGQPIEGATITIELAEGSGRRFTTKSGKKGEFFQVGIPPGAYTISGSKDKLGSDPMSVRVRAGQVVGGEIRLSANTVAASKEAAAKGAELKKIFDEGVTLSSAGKHNEAVERFNAAIAVSPTCGDCYSNIGYSYSQLKDWEKAEVAYRKSIEMRPSDAAAYNGLAAVYNAQRKFDLAAEASVKATEFAGSLSAPGGAAGSADAQYNQGVILWNSGKISEAKKAFEGAVAANPSLAEAHYQLGMVLVNEGNMAGAATEFETYLKLAPTGPNAATAKALVDQLKK